MTEPALELFRPPTHAESLIVAFGRLPLVAWVRIVDSGSWKVKMRLPAGEVVPSALMVIATDSRAARSGRLYGAGTETSNQ